MRKTVLIAVMLAVSLLASACASRASGSSFRNSTRTLSPEAKLAIGTIKLEDTKDAVDPQMAAKLLPLWQLLSQLNGSDSAAPQEITAVVDQIQSTMTPEQTAAINSMQITGADMFSVLQQQGQGTAGTFSRSGANGSRPSGSSGGNRGSSGGGGFFLGGGGGPGGGNFAGGGFRNATGTQTANGSTQQSAAQRAQAFQTAANTALVNQVIRLLEGKIANPS